MPFYPYILFPKPLHGFLLNLATEDHDLRDCNVMWFDKSLLSLQRNIPPPSSGLKSKPGKKCLLIADVLVGLVFDHEDGGSTFLHSVNSCLSTRCFNKVDHTLRSSCCQKSHIQLSKEVSAAS
jgi:hypothetical protein